MLPVKVLTLALWIVASASAELSGGPYMADAAVYGSVAGGVAAAIAASRNGAHTVLVDPAARLGGMVSGGLSHTDQGLTFAIGGLAGEFYLRNARKYNSSATAPMYNTEPHVAESILHEMLSDANVSIVKVMQPIDLVQRVGNTITSIHCQDGTVVQAKVFIDGTYEGDLLRLSGADWTYGREGKVVYNESWAGRRNPFEFPFDFQPISPFAEDGSLLPLLTETTAIPLNVGDNLTEAYNFRLCATFNTSNWLQFPPPTAYNSSDYELLRRLVAVLPTTLSHHIITASTARADKFDVNTGSLVSTDIPGLSWQWPTADWATRQTIWEQHKQYTLGYFYFMQNDPSVPAPLRAQFQSLGLCADEWTSNGGWPEQLYVREAIRLVGQQVLVQDMLWPSPTDFGNASIGMGSYAADGHYANRGPCLPSSDNKTCEMVTTARAREVLVAGGQVWTGGEGYVGSTNKPALYQIPYSVLTPKVTQAANLLCPITPSASHVTFATLRMEPQFMILGQAAGTAAALAVRSNPPLQVQMVPLDVLHATLQQQGAVLCHNDYPHC